MLTLRLLARVTRWTMKQLIEMGKILGGASLQPVLETCFYMFGFIMFIHYLLRFFPSK